VAHALSPVEASVCVTCQTSDTSTNSPSSHVGPHASHAGTTSSLGDGSTSASAAAVSVCKRSSLSHAKPGLFARSLALCACTAVGTSERTMLASAAWAFGVANSARSLPTTSYPSSSDSHSLTVRIPAIIMAITATVTIVVMLTPLELEPVPLPVACGADGVAVGTPVGTAVGAIEGLRDGASDGVATGLPVGRLVGGCVGAIEVTATGRCVGWAEGVPDRNCVAVAGDADGGVEGTVVGSSAGDVVVAVG